MTQVSESSAHDAINFHRRVAVEWEARYRKSAFQGRIEAFAECLSGFDISGQEWLDAGCGSGTIARYLAERGCRVLGVDAAEEMIETARNLTSILEHRELLRFQHISTIANLPLPDRSLNGVLCSSVLEYVSDPGRCLGEFARILRPGGLLVVSVPNRYSAIRRLRSAIHSVGRVLDRKWFEFLDYSRNEYSESSFRALLGERGFSTQRTLSFDNPVHLGSWRPVGGTLLAFCAVRER